MLERAPAPSSSWPETVLRCPHITLNGRCDAKLFMRTKFPPAWTVYALALKSEAQASGSGPIKLCGGCNGWVEVVIRAR